jgi:amino acid adenylation domain-containing protein
MIEPTGPAAHWSDEDLEGSVTDRFERQVDSHPHRLAIRVPGQDLTYGDLDRRANEIAWSALDALGEGVEPMGILLGDRAEAIASILAAPKAGKAALTLDPSLPEERLRFLVEDSGARLIVCSPPSLPLARSLASSSSAQLVNIAALATGRGDRPGLHAAPDTPAVIVYTSGSTGQPKGVAKSHRQVLWGCRQDSRRDRLADADRRLLVSSPASGAGISIHYTLLNGASLFPFVLETAGIQALRDWIVSQEITIYQSVPTVFRSFVRSLRPGDRFPSLRIVRIGGDTVRREDVQLFQRHFFEPCRLAIGYSSTEAGSMAFRFIGAEDEVEEDPVAVGRPSEGVEIRLIDECGQDVMPGKAGEITVTSRYLAEGYWRRPELTRERFVPDPAGGLARTFRTGDIGRFGPDGLLFHIGRKDHQVKIRGHRVEVEEVEAALRSLPEVEDAAVRSHPGPGGEDVLVGYVVRRGSPADAAALRAGLQRTLPDHLVPAAFVSLKTLPLTAGHKVDRTALPPPSWAPDSPERVSAGPGDEYEPWLTGLWERLLGVRPVDVRADFFEMGGNSLLAVELFSEIERRTGRRLPLSFFIQASSIEKLAGLLRRETPPRWPCVVPLQPQGTRLPFFCVSWGHGEVLSYAPLASRLGPDRPVYGLRRDRLADGRPRFTRVEEMAAQYVEEIRTVQPSGPYQIGGLSLGGALAFEMAHQLTSNGQEVGALILMDPSFHAEGGREPAPVRSPGGRPLGLRQQVVWYWTKWQLLDLEERRATLGKKVRRLLRSASQAKTPAPDALAQRTTGPAVDDLVEANDLSDDVDRYDPRIYSGRATLILARHQEAAVDRRRIWSALLPELEIRVVPGLHEFILQEPFVRALAREVERCLLDRPGTE